MDELVEWYGQQLDTDERIARAASDGPWKPGVRSGLDVVEGAGWTVCNASDVDVAHIIRHDPARVLREIDAKRQLLNEFIQTGSQPDIPERRATPHWKGEFGYLQGLARAVHVLASAYADRPGYKESWRP